MTLTRVTVTAAMLAMAACRFEDRTPGGPIRDDRALDAVARALYDATARRDTAAILGISYASSSAVASHVADRPALVPLLAVIALPDPRTDPGAVRVVRTEPRTDGGVATVRVVLSSAGVTEQEATDLLSLVRDGDSWRIAHVSFGPWHQRSTP